MHIMRVKQDGISPADNCCLLCNSDDKHIVLPDMISRQVCTPISRASSLPISETTFPCLGKQAKGSNAGHQFRSLER